MPAPTEPSRLYALEAPPPDDAPTPPQDRAAERAVLGAMLTSAQARDDVLDILTAQDLNLHAHELIWDAIAFLHSGESPERILARLGTTAGGLAQAMHREGRDDLAKPFWRIDFKGRRANRTTHTRKDTTA